MIPQKKNHHFPFNATWDKKSGPKGIHLLDKHTKLESERTLSAWWWKLLVACELAHSASGFPNEILKYTFSCWKFRKMTGLFPCVMALWPCEPDMVGEAYLIARLEILCFSRKESNCWNKAGLRGLKCVQVLLVQHPWTETSKAPHNEARSRIFH